jgi:hypothetical protein
MDGWGSYRGAWWLSRRVDRCGEGYVGVVRAPGWELGYLFVPLNSLDMTNRSVQQSSKKDH